MSFSELGIEGTDFNPKAPDFNENADIRTALRTYHFGESQDGVEPYDPNSIAGFLGNLRDGKISSIAQTIPANANLNQAPYLSPGFYVQSSDINAQNGQGYPPYNPQQQGSAARAGLLKVYADSVGNVFQEYLGATPRSEARVYWRSKIGINEFTDWKASADLNHLHDDLYVSISDVDRLFVDQIKYKTVKSLTLSSQNTSYVLQKEDEDSIILINSGSLPNTIILPQNITSEEDPNPNFIVGASVRIVQYNTGQTTVSPQTSNVTLNSTPGNKLKEIWSVATLTKIGTNTWILTGDLEPDRTNSQLRNEIGIYVQQTQPVGNIQNGDLWFW